MKIFLQQQGVFSSVFFAIFFGITIVLISSLSFTWLFLIAIGVFVLIVLFWSKTPMAIFFYMFIFVLPIDMTKGIIATGGVYTPGFYISLADLFFAPFFLLWIMDKFFQEEKSFQLSPLGKMGAVFLFFLWASALSSYDVQAGVLAAIRHSIYFLMFISVSDYIKSNMQVRKVIFALAGCLLLNIFIGTIQVGSGGNFAIQGIKAATPDESLISFENAGQSAWRPDGLTVHPNAFGNYLVFVLAVLMGVFFARKKISPTYWRFNTLLLIAGVGMLVLTLSRGAWISFTAQALFFLMLAVNRKLIDRRHVVRMGEILVVIVLLTVIIYPAAYLRIIESDHRSSESRWLMMDQAIMITKNNLFFGVGLGGYNRAAQDNIPPEYAHHPKGLQDALLKGVVHNKYLLVSSEHGIIGLALFLLLYFFAIRTFIRCQWNDPLNELIAMGFTSAVVAQLFFYLFDHWYIGVPIQMAWLYFALINAMVIMNNKETEVNAQTHLIAPKI
jgi:O-antigen ligase